MNWQYYTAKFYGAFFLDNSVKTRMWANAQHDGRPAE